jgi:transposase-like protein
MADPHNLSADELVRKVLTDDHADLVREAVSFLCHQIMEAEVSAQIGAGLGEGHVRQGGVRGGGLIRRHPRR